MSANGRSLPPESTSPPGAPAAQLPPRSAWYRIPQPLMQRIVDYMMAAPTGSLPAGEVVQIISAINALEPLPEATP